MKTAPVCQLVQLARDRHRRDLGLQRRPSFPWRFDEARAGRVVEFIERFCRHWKTRRWAGRPLRLEDWQIRDVIHPVFGWVGKEDGLRRYREAYVEVPRKNGKTTMAAGVGLYLTVADGEPGAEVYAGATKKDQAKIVHKDATEMVKRGPLKRHVGIRANNLHVPATGSRFEALGADSDTLDGLNASGLILDELHAQKDRGVYDVLKTAMQARDQPLAFDITTAGVYRPGTIGVELHELALKVLQGVIEDDRFFAFVTTIDEGDDWQDPVAWRKANPNLGISVSESGLAELCDRARSTPSFLNVFLRRSLDVWTGQVDRWLPLEVWDESAGIVAEEELVRRPCFAGLDLSSTTDLSALVLLFPQPEGTQPVLCRFWVPADNAFERAKRDRVPYDAWAKAGLITATAGNVIDYSAIRLELKALRERFDIREIAYDPWNATQLATQLAEEDGLPMIPFRQGYASMSPASKETERMVMGRRLAHAGHPVLRWNVANAAIAEDPAGNIKPDKKRSSERIDGLVALIMAVGRASVHGKTGSIYETRGILTA